MQLVLAFLTLKCNCSVESKKVNNKAERLWCFLMGAIKILDLKDSPRRKHSSPEHSSCGLVKIQSP